MFSDKNTPQQDLKAISEKVDRLFRFEIATKQEVKASRQLNESRIAARAYLQVPARPDLARAPVVPHRNPLSRIMPW
jgi:hypothetical protein